MADRWRRWRLHVALLAIGLAVGAVLTIWDYSAPTKCLGPLACIDYTGAATLSYWAVFGVQALVSSVAMIFLVRSPRRFFRSHVTAAGTLLACIAIGWMIVLFVPVSGMKGSPAFATDPVTPQTR